MMCVFRKCHPGARSAIGSIAITSLLLFLVACGDDESSFASRPGDDSSVETSSSVVQSSSERSGGDPSSSSVKSDSSSATSSSSAALAKPCKTETEDNCEYGELVDERDGQVYKTVKIGDQVWMAENLNYGYLQRTRELDTSSFCYNDTFEYCPKYGRYYLWSAAMDSAGSWSANAKGCGNGVDCSPTEPVRGVCPKGWHLPSKAEWNTLFTTVSGNTSANRALKADSGWSGNGNGLDLFGFSAIPTGANFLGDYDFNESSAYFWSSTAGYDRVAFIAYLNDFENDAGITFMDKNHGYSVRCIMDEEKTVPESSSSSSAVHKLSWDFLNPDVDYGEMVDDRDGQVYKTVKIGKQVWMAENLNFDTDSSFCTKDSVRYCDKYGRLYVWGTAVDNRGKWSANCKYCDDTKTCPMIEPVRGVCPAGWHLPSKAEWDTLYTAVGGESTAGKVLKSLSGWYKDGNGTDDFGFSVLPAGYGAGNMAYYRETYDAYFWASTDGGSSNAYSRELNWDRDSADRDGNYKYYGYSVRCIKDSSD